MDIESLLQGKIKSGDCSRDTIESLLRIIRIQQLMISGAYGEAQSVGSEYLTGKEIESLFGAHSCNLYPFYLVWDVELDVDAATAGYWACYQSTDVLLEFLDLPDDYYDCEPSRWKPVATPHDFFERIKCANEHDSSEGANMEHLLAKPDNWLILSCLTDEFLSYKCFYFEK